MAAELTGLHPQTLRSYERLGLITPGRTGGGGRRYSHSDIELLRTIADLTASGIGIEGVRRILQLQNQVEALQLRNTELQAELEGALEALRQALAGRRVQAPPAGNTLPVLRAAHARRAEPGHRGVAARLPVNRPTGEQPRLPARADDGSPPRTYRVGRLWGERSAFPFSTTVGVVISVSVIWMSR
ncbi:MAG: MerR family transcriptional regulator [Nocardioides sp.]